MPDRVRVSPMMPPGHVRAPAYLRGKTGVIERALGYFANPEQLAYRRPADKRRLYRVRFTMAEVWGTEAENPDDTLDAEIYRALAGTAGHLMPHDHHDHDHLSPSGHPYRPDDDVPLSYWQTMEIAMRELLIDKGITTAEEIARQIDTMDARSARQRGRRGRPRLDRSGVQDATAGRCQRRQPRDGVRYRPAAPDRGREHRQTPITSSSAHCARATRATCWVCRPTGTNRAPTGQPRGQNPARGVA